MEEYREVLDPPKVQLSCCQDTTSALPLTAQPTMRQRLRRGSGEWFKSSSRRSAVESGFSGIQSSDGEDLAPCTLMATGLVRDSLPIACLLAATNIRLSRNRCRQRHARRPPPALDRDEVDDRWVELDEEAESPAAA